MFKQTNINIMHSGIVYKTRYDDLGKSMKETSFTVKTLGGNLPKKQSIKIKKSFKSSTNPLSLNSTILVDELTSEPFYCFKTSELSNIWMLHPQLQLESPIYFLEGFLHNSRPMVVAITSVSSPMESSDLLWNSLLWWNRENLVTKP